MVFYFLLAIVSFGVNSETYKNWSTYENVDAIDDSVRRGAYTESLNKIYPYRASLYVFCDNGMGMKAYITNIGYYPKSNSPFSVDIRADKKTSTTETWLSLSSTDGVWNDNATKLVNTFKKANNVIIRTNSGISGADTWSFSASGFTKAIGQAKQQCAHSEANNNAIISNDTAKDEAEEKFGVNSDEYKEAKKEAELKLNPISSAQSSKKSAEIARYNALIQDKISRNWLLEPSMKGKTCTLAIRLAPDGLVLSARRSKGDENFCASAKRATLKSKKLPIPKDPEISPQFRDFEIILAPDL